MEDCGCLDTTPCEVQECGCKFEVDAGCVRYTGDALSCINSQTGDRLSDILLQINEKFCNIKDGTYIEVTKEPIGGNCSQGGVKITVKQLSTDAVISTEYLCTIQYTLPISSPTLLGGVIIGDGLSVTPTGVLSATYSYILPIASPTILGGVKVGTGLSIDGLGVLSSTYSYTLPVSSPTILGGVKVGTGLSIDGSGVLSSTYSYTLPIASPTVLGGVKVGTGLSIDGSGVLSTLGIQKGYINIIKSNPGELTAQLIGLVDIVTYSWSIPDTDQAIKFPLGTNTTNIQLVDSNSLRRPITLKLNPEESYTYKYEALIKVVATDINGYTYSAYYTYSITTGSLYE
jgi:hypothetical protein